MLGVANGVVATTATESLLSLVAAVPETVYNIVVLHCDQYVRNVIMIFLVDRLDSN